MRLLETIIYTDRLSEVRAFYAKHFVFRADSSVANTFSMMILPEARLTFVDAASANVPPSQGMVVRLAVPIAALERSRLLNEGLGEAIGELAVGDWGDFFGEAVHFFMLTDPSGTRLHLFEAQYGEDKALIIK
jgi:hypothetical protein